MDSDESIINGSVGNQVQCPRNVLHRPTSFEIRESGFVAERRPRSFIMESRSIAALAIQSRRAPFHRDETPLSTARFHRLGRLSHIHSQVQRCGVPDSSSASSLECLETRTYVHTGHMPRMWNKV